MDEQAIRLLLKEQIDALHAQIAALEADLQAAKGRLKPTLQHELLVTKPTLLGEAFSLSSSQGHGKRRSYYPHYLVLPPTLTLHHWPSNGFHERNAKNDLTRGYVSNVIANGCVVINVPREDAKYKALAAASVYIERKGTGIAR
ncbi:hypothetical protein Tco_0557926 [Tanacetum coccineum]